MDEINKIKKLHAQGMSKNALAKRFKRSWETIHRVLSLSDENLRIRGKRPNRSATVMTEEIIEFIKGIFTEEDSKRVKKKQKHTGKKIFQKLKEEKGYTGSLRLVQSTVTRLRKESGKVKELSYLPLDFSLGSVLQVDHGEADVVVNGFRYTSYLFVASVPGYSLRYCQCFPIKSNEAWGEFHERAFQFYKGIFKEIIYDNDTVLVTEILGTERKQTTFSLCMEEHYGFLSRFCNPASGNEKGAVENAVGYCRRNFLAGVPEFASWDELNNFLLKECEKNISEGTHYKTGESLKNIFDRMDVTFPLMPRKIWAKEKITRVDRCQLATVDKKEYSLPENYVGAQVRVKLSVFRVDFYKDDELICSQERLHKEESTLDLNNYLDQLIAKPGAFWDCKATKQYTFNPKLIEMWERLSKRYVKTDANRQLIEILLLGRKYGQELLITAVDFALLYGAVESAAVETIIRQLGTQSKKFDSEGVKALIPHVVNNILEFNISQYKDLCQETYV